MNKNNKDGAVDEQLIHAQSVCNSKVPLKEKTALALSVVHQLFIETYKNVNNTQDISCFDDEKEIARECCKRFVEHMKSHLDTFQIYQEDIDLYKVTAWYGAFLWEKSEHISAKVIVCALWTLLKIEHRTVEVKIIRKIIEMLNNDNKEHSFCKNGLYMIFKACSKTSPYPPTAQSSHSHS